MSRNGGERDSVAAVFSSPAQAERAVEGLRSSGVADEQISVVGRGVPDAQPLRGVGAGTGSNVSGAAAVGAIFGAIIGGVAGWLSAIGNIALPGQTPSSGIGALAATMVGAGLGAALAGLLGGLVGLRIPTETAEQGEDQAQTDAVLVTVLTPVYSDSSRVEAVLSANGGQELFTYSSQQHEESDNVESDRFHVEPDYQVAPGYSGELSDNSGLPGIGQVVSARDNPQTPPVRINEGRSTATDPSLATVAAVNEEEAAAGARADVDESTGEPNWYEALPDLPVGAASSSGSAEAGQIEDAETWADLAAMEANSDMEETTLNENENEEGKNPNNVTGTQGSINPDTGTFGTAGTPMTAGYGVSGSTIGSGTSGGQEASESGDFRGATADSAAYEMGGRGSIDSRKSLEGAERDAPVVDKYAGQNTDAAAPQREHNPQEDDIYQKGPSYGDDASVQSEVARTDLYNTADVDAPPSYATMPTQATHASAGTNIPGPTDRRGLGDNTDEVG